MVDSANITLFSFPFRLSPLPLQAASLFWWPKYRKNRCPLQGRFREIIAGMLAWRILSVYLHDITTRRKGTPMAQNNSTNPNDTLDITTDVCPMTFVKTRLKLEKMTKGQILAVILNAGEPLKKRAALGNRDG
jgi:hypothetical protein